MRLNILMFPCLFALASLAPAQEEFVRGEVSLNPADNVFYLRHTGWALKFEPGVILDNWVGKPLMMKMANFGTAIAPALMVSYAEPTEQMLTLGEMTIGSKADVTVVTAPSAFVSVCLEEPTHMSWAPIHGVGVWMLEQSLCGYVEGFADDSGLFRRRFVVPYDDALVGLTYVAQAMTFDVDHVHISNLDSRVVTAK